MSGKFYIKPFSKEWWKNYWYYYKWPTIIGAIVLTTVGLLIADLTLEPRADFSFMYAGHMKGMGSTDGYDLEKRFSKIVSDIDGDGKYHVASEVIYLDNEEVYQQDSAMGVVLDSTLAAGEQTVFFSSEYVLDRFPVDDMQDLSAIVAKYKIDESMVLRTERGVAYAVSMADNPIFKDMPGVNPSDMYLLVRRLRYNDQSEYKKNLHAHGMEMAEHIISGGKYIPKRRTLSIK